MLGVEELEEPLRVELSSKKDLHAAGDEGEVA